MTLRVAVLISGGGSNLGAIISAIASGELDAQVVGVISNNPAAYGLERARAAGIEHRTVEPIATEDRADFDARLASIVLEFEPELVVLAGWMRLLSPSFLDHFDVINLHPAKPGQFPGLHAIERAFEAWERGELSESGVMVHEVPDAGVDDGPVLLWEPVPLLPDDDLASFEERIHQCEHRLLVEALSRAVRGEAEAAIASE